MEYTTFRSEWKIHEPTDDLTLMLLRAQNETNRLLAEIGTLLERVTKPAEHGSWL